MSFANEEITTMIYSLRGFQVMLDSDLANLYGVETGALNRQVRRNISRFPSDFLIEPTLKELEDLRCQFGIANLLTLWNYKRRSIPMFFTENGIAMLSSVLNNERAIQINIAIMRTFTKLRNSTEIEKVTLKDKVSALEEGTHKLFRIVFERLDDLEEQTRPQLPAKRKKIGLKTK